MGFSSELCSPQGHGAVQQMQEAELRLLEGMRKWMAQRVKSDREYAGLLHHMSLQDSGGQSWSSGPDSHVSQVRAPPLVFSPDPWRWAQRCGKPRLGAGCHALPAPRSHTAAVLGRDNQSDGELEPGAAAAC